MDVGVCLVLVLWLAGRRADGSLGLQEATVTTITRQNDGDIFSAKGGKECNLDTCVGLSSGTAEVAEKPLVEDGQSCTCQCHRHLPAFREDLRICVDDIHECSLAPFVSGSMSQTIPFVFLPLKGQIVHPSKEISFAGVRTPICAVSSAQFMTESGWVELRNPLDADVPFRLFRDEGRTFLQWVGESDLRARMSGRLVLVRLMCRELASDSTSIPENPRDSVFTPCVAFRVVGTPMKYLNNVSEVLFAPDAQASDGTSTSNMSVSEYVAIGICSILLGLIYVASVFLYLHIRKRRKDIDKGSRNDGQNLASAEEGIVKSNPLLGMGRHFAGTDNSFSDSGSSDTDMTPDILQHHDDRKKSSQTTSVLVHPQHQQETFCSMSNFMPPECLSQDSSTIERLPEENVSIVETLEGREDRPDPVRAINGTARRKLYFNPAYFEPQLLVAPPPAAIEFLTKIREVITIAKMKMAAKRFAPSLMGIPEEENHYAIEPSYDLSQSILSRRSSLISLKRENSRRRRCSGCPGCEPQDLKSLCGKLPEFPSMAACENCASSASESKQRSIRKWLEDVPVLKSSPNTSSGEDNIQSTNREALTKSLQSLGLPETAVKSPKRVRSPTRLLSHEDISLPIRSPSPDRALSPRSFDRAKSPLHSIVSESALERAKSPSVRSRASSQSSAKSGGRKPKKALTKPKAPPPPLPTPAHAARIVSHSLKNNLMYDVPPGRNSRKTSTSSLPPPDMINEAIMVDNKTQKPEVAPEPEEEPPKIPTITKKMMKAVINEFATQRGLDPVSTLTTASISALKNSEPTSSPKLMQRKRIDYDADSLERNGLNKGYCTPTEYADVSSSQPSPSLSTALPIDEEITIQNSVPSPNTRMSKIGMGEGLLDDHDYELIVLSKKDIIPQPLDPSLYHLPELLHGNSGYSLVSEVYVNNGYNYGSAPSSTNSSNNSTMETRKPKPKPKIRYDEPENKPGHLTIEVEDCPDNYIRVEDSDSFEPDTLDRPPSKLKLKRNYDNNECFIDSLERPQNQILLKSNGSFKSESLTYATDIGNVINGSMNRNFGSLREIYEAKTKFNMRPSLNKIFNDGEDGHEESWTNSADILKDYEGRILTLEERHAKRQRRIAMENKDIQPDVIPPPHCNAPIYEKPKPPRKVLPPVDSSKPPLPPKNASGRSTNRKKVEGNVPSSPNPSICSDRPSSISGASVNSPNTSDYETCAVGDLVKNDKSAEVSILKNFIHANDVVFKNGLNNQFILQTTTVTATPPIIEQTQNLRNVKKSPKMGMTKTLLDKELMKHMVSKNNAENVKKSWRKNVGKGESGFSQQKPEDSGYLSTDSYESLKKKSSELGERLSLGGGSETDESLGDGHSESGAESIETHSVFFGSYRKMSCVAGSVDSGVGSDLRPPEPVPPHVEDNSDSETMSFTTVIPSGSGDSSLTGSQSSRLRCT